VVTQCDGGAVHLRRPEREYRIGHGTAWTVEFEKDLTQGSFGRPPVRRRSRRRCARCMDCTHTTDRRCHSRKVLLHGSVGAAVGSWLVNGTCRQSNGNRRSRKAAPALNPDAPQMQQLCDKRQRIHERQ
jgi:hypothetical protein